MKKGDVLTVLIDCTNDKTGKAYKAGDTIVAGEDFLVRVCQAWVNQTPPVLEVANGGNS